jgi:hypothetical protein
MYTLEQERRASEGVDVQEMAQEGIGVPEMAQEDGGALGMMQEVVITPAVAEIVRVKVEEILIKMEPMEGYL